MKALLITYINVERIADDRMTEEMEKIIAAFKKQNKELLDKFLAAGYELMFVPTKGESTHIEQLILEA